MIENFLQELKSAYYLNGEIFMEGSCFRLYKILKTIFPDAEPYYSQLDGHWITKINGEYYDINGCIDEKYKEFKNYELVTCNITLKSAYIPTYKGQSTSYSKYK